MVSSTEPLTKTTKYFLLLIQYDSTCWKAGFCKPNFDLIALFTTIILLSVVTLILITNIDNDINISIKDS